MNKITAKLLTITIGFLACTTSFGQTQVPNTFQSGQPARAAEVNANFSTVETAVNTNATAISAGEAAISANAQAIAAVAAVTVPRMKSNAQDIGALLNGTMVSDFVSVLSNTGYTFEISPGERPGRLANLPNLPAGTIRYTQLRYPTSNCTGQAYVGPANLNSIAYFGNGVVISSPYENDPTRIYYSPKGSTPVQDVIIQSQTNENQGACELFGPATMDAIQVIPNDPQITGVPSQLNFDSPITLDVQTYLVPIPPP